jgi:phage-related protein
MSNYPTFTYEFDASSFRETAENPVIASEAEGGYTLTRPRFTRAPRRTFRFRHRNITDAEKQTLLTFWNDRKGGSGAFNWTHPIQGTVINVRFGPDMEMEFERIGFGTNHRWDSGEIILVEV